MEPIDVIIETPSGSTVKYNYDAQLKVFRLAKTLPLGLAFPFDFGFIPDTKGEDGDPLDITVVSEFKNFPGCMVTCKIVGCIKASQTSGKDKTQPSGTIVLSVYRFNRSCLKRLMR